MPNHEGPISPEYMRRSTDRQIRFMELLEPLLPSLERFALALTKSEEGAKDIVSETVMIAYEQFDDLRNSKAFLSYLFTIATRTHQKWSRAARRDSSLDEIDIERLMDTSPPPDVAADIAAVYTALGELPEKQREAVILFEIIGMPMKEIQKIQGGTLISVKVRISRGRKKLAEILGVEPANRSNRRNDTEPDTDTTSNDFLFFSMGIEP